MSVRTNVNEVMQQLDDLADQIQSVATVRALNTLRDQAEVAGFRKVNDEYDVKASTMEQYATLKPASSSDLESSITVKGRGFPLSAFNPVQTREGVSVSIKHRRFTIPHAFMVGRFGLHVFARGAYGGKSKGIRPTGESFGRFVFGKGRLPISELWTMGPTECFSNEDVTQAMQDRVDQQASAVFAREIKAVARGY